MKRHLWRVDSAYKSVCSRKGCDAFQDSRFPQFNARWQAIPCPMSIARLHELFGPSLYMPLEQLLSFDWEKAPLPSVKVEVVGLDKNDPVPPSMTNAQDIFIGEETVPTVDSSGMFHIGGKKPARAVVGSDVRILFVGRELESLYTEYEHQFAERLPFPAFSAPFIPRCPCGCVWRGDAPKPLAPMVSSSNRDWWTCLRCGCIWYVGELLVRKCEKPKDRIDPK